MTTIQSTRAGRFVISESPIPEFSLNLQQHITICICMLLTGVHVTCMETGVRSGDICFFFASSAKPHLQEGVGGPPCPLGDRVFKWKGDTIPENTLSPTHEVGGLVAAYSP